MAVLVDADNVSEFCAIPKVDVSFTLFLCERDSSLVATIFCWIASMDWRGAICSKHHHDGMLDERVWILYVIFHVFVAMCFWLMCEVVRGDFATLRRKPPKAIFSGNLHGLLMVKIDCEAGSFQFV